MRSRLPIPYSLVLLLLFICSACSSSTAPAKPAATRSTQAPTGNRWLANPVVYTALGASDAVGVGADQPDIQGYVSQIAAHLPRKSHLINLGISGIHLHEALNREIPLALSTDPQLITIWLVANDFVANVPYESYSQDLETLLRQLHTGTHAHIFMANLPDLTLLPAFARLSADQKTQMQTSLQQWNAGIGALAARYQVTVVDLFARQSQLTAHPEYVSGDGFHPSPAGYTQLANFFWQAISAQHA